MAPTKKDGEKGAKLTPEQSAAMILNYLRKQNRPYSATDISANLKNRVTKAGATKLLKDMHERNEIEGKAAGKQVVYHAIQDEADGTDVSALQEIDAEVTSLGNETAARKAEEKELRAALREGAAVMPLPELRAAVMALQQQKAGMEARMANLKGGGLQPVSLEEREKVDVEYSKWWRTAGNRRKIRAEMWKDVSGRVEKGEVEKLKEALALEF